MSTYTPPDNRECRKAHDRNRGRDAAYWRAYREGKKNGS